MDYNEYKKLRPLINKCVTIKAYHKKEFRDFMKDLGTKKIKK